MILSTYFIPKHAFAEEIAGIGVQMDQNFTVTRIIPGGTVDIFNALDVGDRIVGVSEGHFKSSSKTATDDLNLRKKFTFFDGMELKEGIKLINGPTGSLVSLIIHKENGKQNVSTFERRKSDEIFTKEFIGTYPMKFRLPKAIGQFKNLDM